MHCPRSSGVWAVARTLRKMLEQDLGFILTMGVMFVLLVQVNTANARQTDSRIAGSPTAEFHFARLVYDNAPGSRRASSGWGDAWQTDYADAEFHLMQGIRRFSGIDVQTVDIDGYGGRLVTLDDDRVFDYPWLYAVEVGQWYLDDSEAARLREYLDRGGFLLVDDFWGDYEWSIFIDSMRRVFPDRPIVELSDDHEIMHIHFDIHERTQIPGRYGSRQGTSPQWRAIFDDDGRVVVAINFNMDMGDAWEHADDPMYPAEMTGLAYRFTMNYVVYSMTH